MSSISITDVKACQISEDGAELTLTLATRYVGDMRIVMPIECREQVIAALTQASAGARAEPAVPKPMPQAAADKSGSAADPKAVTVKVPKKWMVTTDAERHGVVLVVFDHQTPGQSAYALKPGPAKEFALGITKSADALLARKADN